MKRSMAVPDSEAIQSNRISSHNAETVFKALANETRLRIVRMLRSTEKALCVCEIVDALQMPEYQISRHLAALKKSGLVTAEKHSTWAYHRLTSEPALAPLWSYLDASLVGDPYDADIELLRRRLTLRAGDYCVVGFVSRDELERARAD